MKPVSVEAQAKQILDYLIDRMYALIEMGDTEGAKSIYCEIQDWIADEENKDKDFAEVLSIEIY